MKKIYLSILILLIQLTAFSQSPTLQWAKAMGQSLSLIPNDIGTKIIPLSNGDLYFIGRFGGTVDFDPGAGVSNLTAGGVFDIVIAKYSSTGNLIWAKKIGGSNNGSNNGHIITPGDAVVDNADNIYITGQYVGTIDMDPSAAQYLITPPPTAPTLGYRIFAGKYNSNGDLQWAFGYGHGVSGQANGSENEGLGLTIDNAGNLIVAGTYHDNNDFDPGAGIFELTATGFQRNDIFFAKYTASGSFVWAKSVGGGGVQDTPTDLKTDAGGNIYLSGYIDVAVDFDPGPGVATVSSNGGGADIVLARYDANGNYQWAFSIGSSVFYDVPGAIGFDKTGNIIMTGYYTGTVDFDPGAGTTNLTSISSPAIIPDIFIAKYNTGGNLIWAKSLEGSGYKSSGIDILMDKFERIFIAGSFTSTLDLDPSPAVATLDAGPTATASFIAQYDNDGNYLNAGPIVGPDSYLNPWGLFVDQSENIYFTGGFKEIADFDPGAAVFNLSGGNTDQDIFMAKYNTGNALLSGTLWRDDNLNGIQDNAEPGLSGFTMQIIYDRNNDGTIETDEGIISTLTVNNGSYTFSEMPQGNYIVRPVPPGGYTNTTAATADGDLTNGQVITGKDFGVHSSVLPITCSNFSVAVRNNTVVLKWRTETETNSRGFNIQRSTDGINFENIGWVNARGNSSTAVDYTFTNTGNFSSKVYYYRLQEVSIDGNQKFVCNINSVRFTEKNKLITISPNPAQNYVNIDMSNLTAGHLTIVLYDAKGMLVKNRKMSVNTGSAYERITIAELPAGLYMVVISCNNAVIAKEKIIKN